MGAKGWTTGQKRTQTQLTDLEGLLGGGCGFLEDKRPEASSGPQRQWRPCTGAWGLQED